jgi:hypothetical protein
MITVQEISILTICGHLLFSTNDIRTDETIMRAGFFTALISLATQMGDEFRSVKLNDNHIYIKTHKDLLIVIVSDNKTSVLELQQNIEHVIQSYHFFPNFSSNTLTIDNFNEFVKIIKNNNSIRLEFMEMNASQPA